MSDAKEKAKAAFLLAKQALKAKKAAKNAGEIQKTATVKPTNTLNLQRSDSNTQTSKTAEVTPEVTEVTDFSEPVIVETPVVAQNPANEVEFVGKLKACTY